MKADIRPVPATEEYADWPGSWMGGSKIGDLCVGFVGGTASLVRLRHRRWRIRVKSGCGRYRLEIVIHGTKDEAKSILETIARMIGAAAEPARLT